MCALNEAALTPARPSGTATASSSPQNAPYDVGVAHPLDFWWVLVAVFVAFFLGRLVQFTADQRRGIGRKWDKGGR